METIHYPNKITPHFVTIVSIAPFNPKSISKLRSALHFRYSIVIPRFIPYNHKRNPNNHGFITFLTATTLFIVTTNCTQRLLVLTLYLSQYF